MTAPKPGPNMIEGALVPPGDARFVIVASRFNAFIVDRLIEGALDALSRHGVGEDRVTVVRAPGSWELPLLCSRIAKSGKADAVIALGAVIRGGTPHFDYVAAEAAKGIATASATSGVPIAFGVLTTDSIEQAIERAGTKMGNKGFEAAMTAIEMVNLESSLSEAGF